MFPPPFKMLGKKPKATIKVTLMSHQHGEIGPHRNKRDYFIVSFINKCILVKYHTMIFTFMIL